MKPGLFLVILGTVFQFALAEDITFTNRTETFEDLQGHSYRRVQLVRGDQDGLIWRNGASGGRICYTNLDVDLLESFGISSNRVEIARARAAKKAAADARYRAVVFRAPTNAPIQNLQTNAVASVTPPNLDSLPDRFSQPPYPAYAYPPQFIDGFGVPTLAPSAPSAVTASTAGNAMNAPGAATSGRSMNAGPAATVTPAANAAPVLTAPSAPAAAPVRRR
jgi:hypothetical protein